MSIRAVTGFRKDAAVHVHHVSGAGVFLRSCGPQHLVYLAWSCADRWSIYAAGGVTMARLGSLLSIV